MSELLVLHSNCSEQARQLAIIAFNESKFNRLFSPKQSQVELTTRSVSHTCVFSVLSKGSAEIGLVNIVALPGLFR